MELSFETIINTIFYIGCIQGIILTIFLFNVKTNIISNRLLGILTFLWAVILLVFALQSYGLYRHFPHLLKIFFPLLFAWFPLFYLSVKYLITSHYKFVKVDLLHFIPMSIIILLNFGFYFKSGSEKLDIVNSSEGYYFIVDTIGEEMLSIQGIVYSIFTLIILSNYMQKVVEFHSNISLTILKGIKAGIILSLIAWVIGILGTIIERAQIDIGIDLFLFVYLFFVAIIYIISIIAIRSPEVYKLKGEDLSDLLMPSKLEKSANDLIVQKNINQDIKKDGLGFKEEAFETELNDRLLEFMEKSKPYLNPDFSLQALSDDLSVSRHQLSATINSKQKMNFYEFINAYRVNEVIALMKDSNNKNKNNYDLAFDAGFNSKATFYRIFKQLTLQTPSDYRSSFGNG